jgi:hypothetical protein
MADENRGSMGGGERGGDPRDDSTLRGKLGEFVPDMLKKALVAGLGVLFTTEEGIRRMATDFSLPKDVVTFLVAQANATKSELFKVVGREIREFLTSINLHEEIAKLLTNVSFEIKTEIRFIPNDEALVKPKVDRKVAVKRRREEPPEAPEPTPEKP